MTDATLDRLATRLETDAYDRAPGNVMRKQLLEEAFALRAQAAEVARLTAELEKANNEFGSQTAAWPDLWRRIAQLKELSGERYRRAETAEAEVARLREALAYYASDEAWTFGQVEGPDGDYGRKARAALSGGQDKPAL